MSEALPGDLDELRAELATQVSWSEWTPESEPNDEGLGFGETLDVGTGLLRMGQLSSWGWDASATVDRRAPEGAGCSEAESNFPLAEATENGHGNYAGDVDWLTFQAPEATLEPPEQLVVCVSLTMELSEPAERPLYDLMLYQLDDCEPMRPLGAKAMDAASSWHLRTASSRPPSQGWLSPPFFRRTPQEPRGILP